MIEAGRSRVLALFFGLHAIVLYNAILHPAYIGYDAVEHLKYVDVLATLRLPEDSDSGEFYSPPLPYVVPAAARALGVPDAAKVGQLFQALVSMALVVYLLKLCQLLRPGDRALQIGALLLCGMLPVYYKTFCQIRGEPYVALLTLMLVHEAAAGFMGGSLSVRRALLIGFYCGSMLLARQWGALPIVGIVAYGVLRVSRRTELRWPFAKATAFALVTTLIVSGWFYLSLHQRYASIRYLNTSPQPFSLRNQPAEFYAGVGTGKLFTDPVRPSFANQLWPIFYSDTWGDYWCYFLIYGYDPATGRYLSGYDLAEALEQGAPDVVTNRTTMAPYLGRVNLASLAPTLLLLAGLMMGARAIWRTARDPAPDRCETISALLAAVVIASAVGYGLFLIWYPVPGKGDTIKGSYLLHVFPPLALLGAELLSRLRTRSVVAWRSAVGVLVIVLLHNAATLVTHHP